MVEEEPEPVGKGRPPPWGGRDPAPRACCSSCAPPPQPESLLSPLSLGGGGVPFSPHGERAGSMPSGLGVGGTAGGGVHLTSRFLGCCGVPPTPPEEAPALGPRQVSPSVGVEEEKLGRAGFRGGFSSACPALDPQEMSGGGGLGVWVHPRDLGGEGCCRFTVYPPKKSRGARGDDDEDDEDDVESDIREY